MEIQRISIDTSKHVFTLHGVDAQERPVLRRELRRSQIAGFFEKLSATEVALEACAGSHHWGRLLTGMENWVKLIPPQYMKPFVKQSKNDHNDAEAICEAAFWHNRYRRAVHTNKSGAVQVQVRARASAPFFARIAALSSEARVPSMRSVWCSLVRSTPCRRSQTPAWCQSRSRRQQLMPQPQPISWGSISQGRPDFGTNRLPVSAARLSTGGRPPFGRGCSGGNSGFTTAHSSSETRGLAKPSKQPRNRACRGFSSLSLRTKVALDCRIRRQPHSPPLRKRSETAMNSSQSFPVAHAPWLWPLPFLHCILLGIFFL